MGLGDLFGGGNVNKLLAKIDELKAELDAANQQTQVVKGQAQGDRAEVKRIKKEMSDLRELMRKEQEKVRSLKASKASLAERLEQSQSEIDGLKAKVKLENKIDIFMGGTLPAVKFFGIFFHSKCLLKTCAKGVLKSSRLLFSHFWV